MEIERNDVNISKLFTFSKEFSIKDELKNTEQKVYIRLIGDAELNRARVFAIRKSAELRKKLRDPESDEHIAYIPDYESLTAEELAEILNTLSVQRFTLDAIKEIRPPLPVSPDSDSDLEEQEKYQEEIDSFEEKRGVLIQEHVKKSLENNKNRLHSLSKEKLEKEYTNEVISNLCEQEMINRFREMCAYFGTYKDKNFKTRYFSSFDEFDNLRSEIKTQFVENYLSLEIGSEELKKSPQATP